MTNITQATSLAAINKMIVNISRSAAKLNETIHTAGMACIEHAKNYGDATPAARLVDALPMSHRRALVINWFAAFTPIAIAKDKTGKMKAHLSGKQEERTWNVEAAKATPFYAMPEAAVEPDVPTYESLHNNVIQFIKRMETKAAKIENESDKAKALDEINKLRAAAA